MRNRPSSNTLLRCTIFLHSPHLGGAERSALELIQGLSEYGYQIDCVLPTGGEQLIQMLRSAGAQVHELPSITWWTSDPIVSISESHTVQSLLKTLDTDLVITITGVIPQAAIAARELNIPHIWCLHEFLDLDHGLKIPFPKEVFSNIVLEYSEKVICNSKSVRDYFFGSQDSKIEVIYPFPQTLKIREYVEPSKSNPQFAAIGLIANFTPGKGHLLLLQALVKLQQSNIHVKVIFFGEGGTSVLRNEIQEFIRTNSLDQWVEFRGFVSSREEIFKQIQIAIVPSSNEGFGRVPFESMSFGVPVVYSESGALSENLVPYKTGVPFRANDALSLAEAIEEVISKKVDTEKLIINGLKYMKDIYASNSYVSDFIRTCEDARSSYSLSPLESSTAKLILENSRLRGQNNKIVNSTIWRLINPLSTKLGYKVKYEVKLLAIRSKKAWTILQTEGASSLIMKCSERIGLKKTRNEVWGNKLKVYSLETPASKSNEQYLQFEFSVIIPIYNGSSHVQKLFKCLESQDLNIIIVNDGSTELGLSDYLDQWAKSHNATLITNSENIGYTKSVNKAARTIDTDFIVLNSDTEVAGDWSQRLLQRLYSGDRIAALTPFSNSATIFSFPSPNIDNWTSLNVIELQKASEVNQYLGNFETPTLNGFCIAIKRAAWDQIGEFDEKRFPLGYGEECDWSMRAKQLNWTVNLAPDVFVKHVHGGSFDTSSKNSLLISAEVQMRKDWPEYFDAITRHIEVDPWQFLRSRIKLRLLLGTSWLIVFKTRLPKGNHGWAVGSSTEEIDSARHYLEVYVDRQGQIIGMPVSGSAEDISSSDVFEFKDWTDLYKFHQENSDSIVAIFRKA